MNIEKGDFVRLRKSASYYNQKDSWDFSYGEVDRIIQHDQINIWCSIRSGKYENIYPITDLKLIPKSERDLIYLQR